MDVEAWQGRGLFGEQTLLNLASDGQFILIGSVSDLDRFDDIDVAYGSADPKGADPAGPESYVLSGVMRVVDGAVEYGAILTRARDQSVQWSYAVNLAYGVTTARDPQTGQTDVLSYEDEVRSGNVLGPRIYSTGPGVFSYTGVRDLESARRILRRYSDYYDTKTIKEYETGNREVRQWEI